MPLPHLPEGDTPASKGVPLTKDPVEAVRYHFDNSQDFDHLTVIYDPEFMRDQWRMPDGSAVTETGFPILGWKTA